MSERFFEHYRDVPKRYWRWENFKPKEIACKGTGKLLVHERSMDMLQELRYGIGLPFYINSGYRSPEHNTAVGGAKNSFHMRGMAFDINLRNLNRDELVRMAVEIGFRGIGYYNSFQHVDTRITPNVVSWDKRR